MRHFSKDIKRMDQTLAANMVKLTKHLKADIGTKKWADTAKKLKSSGANISYTRMNQQSVGWLDKKRFASKMIKDEPMERLYSFNELRR